MNLASVASSTRRRTEDPRPHGKVGDGRMVGRTKERSRVVPFESHNLEEAPPVKPSVWGYNHA